MLSDLLSIGVVVRVIRKNLNLQPGRGVNVHWVYFKSKVNATIIDHCNTFVTFEMATLKCF